MGAVSEPSFEGEFHQFFRRWTHVFEALPERYNGKTEPFDEAFNRAVVDDITFRDLQKTLLLPQVIGHVATGNAEFEIVLRSPKS